MESEHVFMIPFRTVRIGTLKTFPPRDRRNIPLQFSKETISFSAVLEQKGYNKNAIQFNIPSRGIVLIEAHLKVGCPVIWITFDSDTAERIRRITNMHLETEPASYLDPDSNELAEKRLCIIPIHDPVEESQVEIFYKVVRSIADERNLDFTKIFHELLRSDCNRQLIRCTQYITQLTKFQNSFRTKKDIETETKSAVIVTKTVSENKNEDEHDFIIIASDEEEDSNMDSLSTKLEKKNKKIGSKDVNNTKHRRQADYPSGISSHRSHSYKFQKKEYVAPKRKSSPDLVDFDKNYIPESNRFKHQKFET
ncbi:uncharacterized protein LOC144425034 [Styela clava]